MKSWQASREKRLRRSEIMVKKNAASGFGLIIVGSEILDGRIQDRHFENTRRLLQARNHALIYSMILSDEPLLLLDKLKWAMGRAEPFFCCGGIGGTPDDYTRQCAAQAADLPLEFHAEGVEILKRRPGFPMTPGRLKMVEFPKGAELIPNPVNQVPGFTIRNGHFLPGFPSMAEPMTAWVLETLYEPGELKVSRTLILPGAREGDLVPFMETFTAAHPKVVFSSLPKFVEGGTEVQIGLSGTEEAVKPGFQELIKGLDAMGVAWVEKK
jgi:molybdopterin-biosynthesis enzyme MoeA-like protein